ncbi:MAG: hypothetical protein E7186_04130 [Erysipelotrichaceae bacterium]|nr:hypothetical protein [Erysipelotrichaceae bacterium]
MKEKKVRQPAGVGEKIFQIVNLLLIVAILGTYTYRAYTYKDYFDKLATAQAGEATTLADALLEKANGDLNVFKDDNGDHYYINDPENNYVVYSGRTFRVLRILSDKTVKMAAVDVQGISVLNKNEDFTGSSLFRWLNSSENEKDGIFEKTLRNTEKYLTGGVFCTDKVDDASQIACTVNSEKVNVTMLTLEDYLSTGGAKGFLNNGTRFWLASNNSEQQFWYVNEDGSLSVSDFNTQLVGIRPVIFISADVLVGKGAGTAADPFVLSGEATAVFVSNLYAGDYVKYSDQLWRVVSQDEEATVLMLEGYASENGEAKKVSYGTASAYSADNGAGKYLNGTWVKTLDRYEKFLTEHAWYYGPTGTASDFDYSSSFDKSATCYVGIPNLATPYLGGYNGILLSNYDAHNTDAIYVIDNEGRLFGDYDTVAYKVRPLIAMKASVGIVSGKGTLDNPYIVEVNE